MANQEHLKVLDRGVAAWNKWRAENPKLLPDLKSAYLVGRDLKGVDFRGVNLNAAGLSGADLTKADFSQAYATNAIFQRSTLTQARLDGEFDSAFFSDAVLKNARAMGGNFERAVFDFAHASGADFTDATLVHARLYKTDLTGATLSRCWVHGVSIWGATLDRAKQSDLTVTYDEDKITVDNIEVAQFIYLILNNENVRHIIDTITSKVVLILGRFTKERKAVLDAIRDKLRTMDLTPILFDFQPSSKRDLTETIQLLANMAKFVIADITDAKSIPQELSHIIPNFPSVPVQPIILSSQRKYAMFEHWENFPSVLPDFQYENERHLIENLEDKVIKPVEAWEGKKDKVSALKDKIKELESKLAQKERGD